MRLPWRERHARSQSAGEAVGTFDKNASLVDTVAAHKFRGGGSRLARVADVTLFNFLTSYYSVTIGRELNLIKTEQSRSTQP